MAGFYIAIRYCSNMRLNYLNDTCVCALYNSRKTLVYKDKDMDKEMTEKTAIKPETPCTEAPELAKELGVPALFFKREDLHPYGSHKGRSISVMIDRKRGEGATRFAISSSGNAALAAIRHIQNLNSHGANLSLTVFVGEHIDPEKLATIKSEATDPRISIEKTARPLQSLLQLISGKTSEKNVVNLRQSTDDIALEGYKTLAQELATIPHVSDIFVPTSSGTTAQALADFFVKHGVAIKVHVVQTTEVFPIVRELSRETASASPSIAHAIVDKVAHRKNTVADAVIKTNGSGIIATNNDITTAQKLLREKTHIDVTPNGALGLAGLLNMLEKQKKFVGSIVCIVTGK